ncbi:hypothetical protein BJX99DRAFT_264485 [Aspergillus californicus]
MSSLAQASPSRGDDGRLAVIWKKRFDTRHPSPNPVIAILDTEYNELVKTWKGLQELLPLPDQVLFQERPQTLQDVQALIRHTQPFWLSHSSFNHLATLCDVLSASLDSHTALLTTLPSYQSYSSLFYSALQTIIKASAKYPRTLNGVMRALIEINQSICLSAAHEPHFTKDSMPLIAKFYSLVFFFLGELMDWYTRRFKCRVLKSLREDVYRDFSGLVSTIQSSAREFIHGVDVAHDSGRDSQGPIQSVDLSLWENARLSQLGKRQTNRRSAAQTAMTRLLMWEIQREAEARSKLFDQRGALLSQLLDMASQRWKLASQGTGFVCLTTAPGQDLLLPPTPTETPRHKYTRTELQLASAHLQDHFNDDDQTANYRPDIELIVEEGFVEPLKQWATDMYSQILAVGDSPNNNITPVSLLASYYATLVRDTGLPLVAHFCTLPSTPKADMSLFQQGLIALIYSLIRQLLEHLPPVANGTSARTVKPEYITRLDGTLTSWKEVLSLIDTLLYYAPPLLVCIIDGLDKLQDPSTDEYIRSLLRIFVCHTRKPPDSVPGRQSVLLKALITVTKPPESIVETLLENPLTLGESNGAVSTPDLEADAPLCSDVEVAIII